MSNDDPASLIAEPALEQSPSINLKLLKKGTVLLLEGEGDIYELKMLYPEYGIAEITSNYPALRNSTVGQFMHSVRWSHPGVKLNVIQQGWVTVLRFSNGQFQTQPILSARISGMRDDGSRWSYDVF